MSSFKWVVPLCGAAAITALSAWAQQRAPDPADPAGSVPPVKYESAFAGYRPFAEEKVAPWRQSNDAVKDSGGHGAHGQQPPAQSKPGEGPPAKPPENPEHGGHR